MLLALALCLAVSPFVRRLDLDDWVHYAVLEGTLSDSHGVAATGPWDLFRFSDGSAAANLAFKEAGSLWYTPANWKLAFCRPLASLLVALDHALFGLWAPGYFFHSLLWYVATCGVLARLYQRLLPSLAGGVAGLLFAAVGAHLQPVMWSSSRNALMCAFFGFLALLYHLRFREEGWWPGRWLSLLCSTLALACGEAALGPFAFILSFELFGATGSLRRRLSSLAPLVLLIFLWLGAYVGLGYGTQGSSAYVNPVGDPLGFLRELPLRLGNGAAVLLLAMPADLWFLVPGSRLALGVIGGGGVLVFWFLLRPLASGPEQHASRVLWLSVGSFFALIPQLCGAMGPRSFLIPSFGVCGLVGAIVSRHWGGASVRARASARMLLFLHGGLGILSWPLGAYVTERFRLQADRDFEQMGLLDSQSSRRSRFVISTSVGFSSWYAPFRSAALHGHLPPIRFASFASCDHTLSRISERVFEVDLAGGLLTDPFLSVLADPKTPPVVGNRVRLSDVEFEVLSLNEASQPNRFRVTFTGKAELPEMWAWHEGQQLRVEPPEVGGAVTLKWEDPSFF